MTSHQEHGDPSALGMIGADESAERGYFSLAAGPLRRVWLFAAFIYVTSSLFICLMTGVVKMLIPLGGIAIGVGIFGSVQVFAKIDMKRRQVD